MRTALTIFSGGGLADVGIKAAGFKVIGAIERDRLIAETYRVNHGDNILIEDALEVDYSQFQGVDFIHASPPCQHYSKARLSNLPDHQDKDAGLAVINAARAIKPRWITLENVPDYGKSKIYQLIRESLWELDYWVSDTVINFADLGVPQNRKRLIMIAARSLVGFPLSRPHRSWYSAIADLIPTLPITSLADWQAKKLPHPPESPCLIPRVGCHEFRLIDCDRPAPTIRALGHDRNWRQFDMFSGDSYRIITPRCAARFQSVPDSFKLPDKNPLAWKIIGNGIPCQGMEAIARCLS